MTSMLSAYVGLWADLADWSFTTGIILRDLEFVQ